MTGKKSIRETVTKSLMAIGSRREAVFYTNLFQQLKPERFALIAIDSRCLRKPLLEALISDLRILYDLELTPLLLVGGMEDERAQDRNRTSVRFQAQRLCRELETAGIRHAKINCASYEFLTHMQKCVRNGQVAVLEMTEYDAGLDLAGLVARVKPAKVIFLIPSGGVRKGGKRVTVINIDQIDGFPEGFEQGPKKRKVLELVRELAKTVRFHCTYVIASPLNLLGELFTIKGTGTLLRCSADIIVRQDYGRFSRKKLRASIESAFAEKLVADYFRRPIVHLCLEKEFRGGAIVTQLSGLPYLNKFWVTPEAQGEGISRDIWQKVEEIAPTFFWRSRKGNPFNDWYIKVCDGMQTSGKWRVFWKGLNAPEIPSAIIAAANASHDFEYEKP